MLEAARQAGLELPDGAAPAGDAGESEPELPEDPRFDAAEAALAEGDYALAAERFQAILDAEPANTMAALALRQVGLLSRIEGVDPELAQRAVAEPDNVDAQLAAADLLFANQEFDVALRRLLDLITRVSGAERDAIRTRLLDFFDLLGPEDPRVDPARREMARALF